MGHYLADKKWGLQCTTFPEQGDRNNLSSCLYFSNAGVYSSHHNFLEQYDPSRVSDPEYWLPKGVFNDMMDNGVEPQISNVVDNVSGFTNAQFYSALLNDINSMSDYKNKFLQQNNNVQQNQINELFSWYGY